MPAASCAVESKWHQKYLQVRLQGTDGARLEIIVHHSIAFVSQANLAISIMLLVGSGLIVHHTFSSSGSSLGGETHFFLHTVVHWCAGCAEYFCRIGRAKHSRETRFCFVTLWKRHAQITFGVGHPNGALECSLRQSEVEFLHSRGSKIR